MDICQISAGWPNFLRQLLFRRTLSCRLFSRAWHSLWDRFSDIWCQYGFESRFFPWNDLWYLRTNPIVNCWMSGLSFKSLILVRSRTLIGVRTNSSCRKWTFWHSKSDRCGQTFDRSDTCRPIPICYLLVFPTCLNLNVCAERGYNLFESAVAAIDFRQLHFRDDSIHGSLELAIYTFEGLQKRFRWDEFFLANDLRLIA